VIRQTGAIFVDAYRELNARRLFWIALILSGLVVVAFALVGVSADQHVTILGFDTPIPLGAMGWTAEELYKVLFVYFGINFWLAWLVTILALVTTAGIFPDFIASGSIDLALSKPIGRWRLFLTKYATGLLFVALQVFVFTAATFVVLGLRAGAWEPWLFLAVPVVVVFFSFLFCICTLLGLLTRSTIAALLLTLLAWFGLFAINAVDEVLLQVGAQQQITVERLERQEAQLADRVERLDAEGTPAPQTADRLEATREELESAQNNLRAVERWQGRVVLAKTVLPKTSETINLLRRWLIDLADLPDVEQQTAEVQVDNERPRGGPDAEASARAVQQRDSRSAWWVIGTSLGFEAVVLLIAGWLFARRDF
jgi:ABC-type transport system involved in multi-copper enzyme maturation permease subunit